MNRDELARHLYIHEYDSDAVRPSEQWERDAWANEWDRGDVATSSRERCYARADRLIADGEVPA